MDFKTFLLIIIGSALANNVVLEQFFGVTPALGAKGSAKELAKYGLAVAAVTLVAALCTAGISLGVYSTFVAALWVLIAASVIGHFFTDKYLLIALNGVVFGTCANAAGSGLAEASASALGAGLGFTVALLLFAGVETKIDDKYVPAAFRGFPVRLLAAGILSMAVVAFK